MAIDAVQHTKPAKNMDPAQDDRDPDQIRADGSEGSDAQLADDLQGTQTGGSRNERVTEFYAPTHAAEPATTASGQPGYQGTGGVVGASNATLAEEQKQQGKLGRSNPNSKAEEDQHTYSSVSPEKEQAGSLPSGMAEKVETVEISDLSVKH